jgi:hypothetical protein
MGECFEFLDAFPPIQEAVEELCQRNGEAKHNEIVQELMKHPVGVLVVEAAVARCPQRTKKSIASNYGAVAKPTIHHWNVQCLSGDNLIDMNRL